MVASIWSVSIKTVYSLIDTDSLPYIVLPTPGKRKKEIIPTDKKRRRFIRIRATEAEAFIKQHEVNRDQTNSPAAPRRRRSILQAQKSIVVLKPLENNNSSHEETLKNS